MKRNLTVDNRLKKRNPQIVIDPTPSWLKKQVLTFLDVMEFQKSEHEVARERHNRPTNN